MNTRRVYLTQDLAQARRAIAALHMAGIGNDAISLVARADIELERVPDSMKEADTDAVPAAVRGVGIGGAAGLLAGLVATAVPPLGVTLAGAAAIAGIGALVGGWSSALMGASLPDPVRQQFEDHIAAGRVLVLVDGDEACVRAADEAMQSVSAVHLDYHAPPAGSA
ncbi:MAG TPA: hypothetical protein VL251_08040 [Thermomonas sp.]|nr:hypothetical protein [Thermomonas sp.]